LKLSARDRRILLAAGMGAGVGSIFRAPLAGALFAGEILYSDAELESDVIMPAAIASIIGYTVFSLSLPPENRFVPLFGSQLNYAPGSPFELLPLAGLSLVLVLAAIIYVKIFYGTRDLFKKLPVPHHFRPAIGAALAGLVGIGLYYAMGREMLALGVLGTGYGSLQVALSSTGSMSIALLLAIGLTKILTTSLTISSGGSGGVFGPSMVIGGCVGAAVGEFFHSLSPVLAPHPRAYAIVGMAGFFASCAHAPISTIIMVSEMTGDYKLLLPTMWVSTLCFVLGRGCNLYEKQVPSRLESPAHRGDFLVDVLEGITVRDVPRIERKIRSVPESMPLREIVQLLATSTQRYFPIVDADLHLVGIFSSDDVRSYLYNETIWDLAVARDIITTRIVSVSLDDNLNTALRRFTELNLDELPIIDAHDHGKLLGMLRRKDVISVYNQSVLEHKQAATAQD
jgi:CIC family chloride channel protein